MVFIDGTVVNLALPVLQGDLRLAAADAQWVFEAYALFLSALLLVGGSMGDRLGRRRVFAAGVAVFTIASLACGLATNAAWLIAGRALQGIGGALLTPGSLAIITASFADVRRARAIGTWSAVTTMTAAIGPVAGGWLIEHASWRWVFFLNLPLAAAVLAMTAWHMPESRDETAVGRLDYAGAALATIGLGGLVFGLIESQRLGSGQPVVVASLLVGILGLAAFLVLERRLAHPMLPLALFRSRTFTGTNLLTFLLYGALSGSLFLVPFDLIQVQHYGPTAAGAALLPVIFVLATLSRWAGGLIPRLGARLLLTAGPLIAGVGFALFARTGIGGSYWTTFFPAALMLGLGMAITVAPLTTTVMGSVDPHHAGLASGINNAVSRTAGLLAIALVSVVLALSFSSSLEHRLDQRHLEPATRQAVESERLKLAEAELPNDLDPVLRSQLRRDIEESFVSGFALIMLGAAAAAAASAACGWSLVEGRNSS